VISPGRAAWPEVVASSPPAHPPVSWMPIAARFDPRVDDVAGHVRPIDRQDPSMS
jgi:hypothetical protein